MTPRSMYRYVEFEAENEEGDKARVNAMMLDNNTVMKEYADGNIEPLYALAAMLDAGRASEVENMICVNAGGEELYVLKMRTGGTYAMTESFIDEQETELRSKKTGFIIQ